MKTVSKVYVQLLTIEGRVKSKRVYTYHLLVEYRNSWQFPYTFHFLKKVKKKKLQIFLLIRNELLWNYLIFFFFDSIIF